MTRNTRNPLFFMLFYAFISVLAIAGMRAEWKGARLPATDPSAAAAEASSPRSEGPE